MSACPPVECPKKAVWYAVEYCGVRCGTEQCPYNTAPRSRERTAQRAHTVRPPIQRTPDRAHVPVHTRQAPLARAHTCGVHARQHTGGDGGAKQLGVRVAGSDRVRVEVRPVVVGRRVVASPRQVRSGLHEARRRHYIARPAGRLATRRLARDPRRARRALVAAFGAGHISCARGTPLAQPPRSTWSDKP